MAFVTIVRQNRTHAHLEKVGGVSGLKAQGQREQDREKAHRSLVYPTGGAIINRGVVPVTKYTAVSGPCGVTAPFP